MSPKMAEIYVRLAETLLKLERYPKAIDKATIVITTQSFSFKNNTASIQVSIYSLQAIELLTPVVRQNQNLRAEAFRIRGKAYDSIGERRRSTADYRESELLLK